MVAETTRQAASDHIHNLNKYMDEIICQRAGSLSCKLFFWIFELRLCSFVRERKEKKLHSTADRASIKIKEPADQSISFKCGQR